jgi:hypothetical protein
MSGLTFTKATKNQARLRMAITGPSGSCKTYSALSVGQHLGKRVAVIDTERGSASKYAGEFDFDVLELDSFEPGKYVEAIRAAEAAGYDVLIIDSLSHAWIGKGGALEQVDKAAAKSQSKNTFFAWRDVTPQHNSLVDAMLRSKCHIIVTMRAKTEYVIENVNGRQAPTKIGLAAIQRDGIEYEFDVAADMNLQHQFIPSKTRCRELDGQVIQNPGKQLADILNAWLSDGAPAPQAEMISEPQVSELLDIVTAIKDFGVTDQQIKARLLEITGGISEVQQLTREQAANVINVFSAKLKDLQAKKGASA